MRQRRVRGTHIRRAGYGHADAPTYSESFTAASDGSFALFRPGPGRSMTLCDVPPYLRSTYARAAVACVAPRPGVDLPAGVLGRQRPSRGSLRDGANRGRAPPYRIPGGRSATGDSPAVRRRDRGPDGGVAGGLDRLLRPCPGSWSQPPAHDRGLRRADSAGRSAPEERDAVELDGGILGVHADGPRQERPFGVDRVGQGGTVDLH